MSRPTRGGSSKRPAEIATPSEFTFKVVMLGDSSVGKTSLLSKFADGKLSKLAEVSTVGVDLAKRKLTVDGHNVKLYIWDTAGQEKFRSITRSFYRDAQAVVLCYDITREASFLSIRAWLKEIAAQSPECDILLLGTKLDLHADRKVATTVGALLSKELDVPFFETSSVTGENIEPAFIQLTRTLLRRVLPPEINPPKAGAGAIATPLPTAAPTKPSLLRPALAPQHDWETKAENMDLIRLNEEAHATPGKPGSLCAC
jgi:small GTP-binding protein